MFHVASYLINNVIGSIETQINNIVKFSNYLKDYRVFANQIKLLQHNRFRIIWEYKYPCLNDKTATTAFDGHYIYHTAWAARVLAHSKPNKHIDIGSYLYFSTITSAFIPIDFYDYRPVKLELSDLCSKHCDLVNLPFKSNSIHSLSCMHTIEHVGLGRYGDPIDPNGDLKAIREIRRVTAKKGNLLMVVPIGKKKLQFNAHRIYDYIEFLSYFPDFKLNQFALVTDTNNFVINPSVAKINKQIYGCGCFWLQKI